MIYLKNKDELKELLKKDKVLVDFYADWCGPCNVLGTILDEIEKDIDVEIVKVNTDNFLSLAREYSILSIPNLKLFENGKLVKEQTGILSKDELIRWIEGDK